MKKQTVCIILFILAISLSLFSQNMNNWWKPSKVVMHENTDTMAGFLKIDTTSAGYISRVSFRTIQDRERGTLKAGTKDTPKNAITFFSIGNKRYKYMYYEDPAPTKKKLTNKFDGWIEIIKEGSITAYRGIFAGKGAIPGPIVPIVGGGIGVAAVIVVSGGKDGYTPVYVLQKRNYDQVLIAAPSLSFFKGKDYMKYKIDDGSKSHFISFIQEDSVLAAKVQSDDLLFGDIENYISEYNEWAKSNGK